MVVLQPIENHPSIFLAPTGNESYSTVVNASPNVPHYFPSSSNNPPLYFYQPYWISNQGIMYSDSVNSPLPPLNPPQPFSPASYQYYQYNQYPSKVKSKKQNQQRHSWNGNTVVNSLSSESTLSKLVELLNAPEYKIPTSNKPKLINNKLMKSNKIGQSNRFNNSVYFNRKNIFYFG